MQTSTTRLLRRLAFVLVVLGFSGTAAFAQKTVTLRLNTATIPDTVATDAFFEVRGANLDGTSPYTLPDGNVIDWNNDSTLEPNNVGGDYWEVTFEVEDSLTFKYWSEDADEIGLNTGWETGGNNWSLEPDFTAAGDTTLPIHYFNTTGSDQAYDWTPWQQKEDTVAVWFKVFMNTENAVSKGYDPSDAELQVGLRGSPDNGGVGADGSMIDWGGIVPLERQSDDMNQPGYNLYAGVLYLPESAAGETQTYKYYFQSSTVTGDAGYEDGNDRSFTIPSSDTTLYWSLYSNSPAVDPDAVQQEAQVDFVVDIEPLEEISVYSRARGDEIQVRGSFNGWGCGDPDRCLLFEEALDPTVFSNTVLVSEFPDNTINYKYFVNLNFEDSPEGWEEPLDFGGGNRTFVWNGEDPGLGLQFFDDIRPGNVIPDGSNVEVTFQVDMAPALNFQTKPAFDPAVDTVRVNFQDPVWIYTQTNNLGVEELEDVYLEDPDGDLIYEGTYTVVAPTYNGIGYNYQYGQPTTDEWTDEGDGGFDPGRRRYQYVLPSNDGTFPSSYTMPLVTVQESGLLPFACNPTADPAQLSETVLDLCYEAGTSPVGTGIETVDEAEVPTQITLGANYPNPFNPTTTFEYTIDQTQHVTVRVFDTLGRVVATLVDGTQPAATYRVSFDAADLASGTYLYQIQTPTQTITKSMVLVK